ncbi:MAG: hypothetical protein K2X50_03420 [Gammaproteobacteria bacterium]|nr:hypothetical protein [Gammaproteobacteria bacterium]
MQDNRIEAKNKFDWGNKIIAKQGVKNILSALDYYQKSLFLLRSIEKAEVTEEVNTSIRDALEASLKGINQLLHSTSDWSQVVDALEKFLTFYVDSFKILNKTTQRLPELDALELQIDGPLTLLSKNAPSEPQKERLKNYLAVISLFHKDLATEKNHKLSSNDPVVTKSFALYTLALKVFAANVKIESPAEEEQPPPKKAPPPAPAAVPQFPTSMPPAAKASRSPRINFAKQPKETKLHTFEYIADDGPKRVLIRELMEKKEFAKALVGCRNIMNHIIDDFRCTCECQLAIGKDHAKKRQFIEAITCYTEALQSCTHIRKDDFIEKDIINIATGFISLIHAINELTKNSAVNFLSASECLTVFLNFYLDNFGFLNTENKTRSSLDEINIDFLIEFLKSTPDDTSREKTRVYLAIIRIFSQDTNLENGGLESMMDEIEIKKGIWKDASMLETFNLFDKAVALAKSIKGHPVLNPELNIAPEPEKKRWKDVTGSSSSSFQSRCC